MRVSLALGRLDPVIYFENSQGEISMPPTTDDALRLKEEMGRRGWEMREAGTLPEVDRLQKRLQEQEYKSRQGELEHEEVAFSEVRRQVRDRLIARMVSSSTRPYEREFIRNYLMLREEKRVKYQKRFLADECYITVREFNSKHHLHDILNQLPDMDKGCKRCGRYRRIAGSEYCLGCAQMYAPQEA
jgi:hypothetical protein